MSCWQFKCLFQVNLYYFKRKLFWIGYLVDLQVLSLSEENICDILKCLKIKCSYCTIILRNTGRVYQIHYLKHDFVLHRNFHNVRHYVWWYVWSRAHMQNIQRIQHLIHVLQKSIHEFPVPLIKSCKKHNPQVLYHRTNFEYIYQKY